MSIVCVLHHSISCVLIHIIFLSCASCLRHTDIPNLLTYIDRNHPSPMQRVVVRNSTRDVYVGARNALYHFNSNLRIKRIISTGPELDNPQCLHPNYPCTHNRTITDNDNKVLEIFQSSVPPLLLTCGTLYQGLCQLQSLNDLSRRTWVQPFNETVGFVAGRGSTVAFFAQGYNKQTSLYSASTYDGRPLNYTPASVSSKVLVRQDDGVVLKYSDKTDTSFTGVNFKLKDNYKVEYITGFSYGDFAYFLTTQKVSVESEAIETRLARVCTNDTLFFSYTEVPLKCHFALEVYNLATAAHLGVASAQLKRRLKLDKLADVLFVSFARTLPDHGRLVDRARGSVICSFPMSTVIASFTNATRDCFKAEPRASLLTHVAGHSLKCTKKDEVEVHDYFCGSGFNPYIAGMESIPGGYRNHLDAQITSLATTLQESRTVAIAGTDTGDVIKIDMDKRERILYSKNIAEDQEDKRIQSSNAFDPLYENIYFLVGKKVVKFPIGSCSLYTDCHSCLTMEDPLKCGWCGDHCAHFEECETPGVFSTNTCTPIIFEVSPLNGPTVGGTLVTVKGDNFGTSHGGEHNSKLSIKVAGVPCDIYSWETEQVQCKTKPVNEVILPGAIEINVSDVSWKVGNFDINGTIRSREIFTYLTPVLYGIYPGKGPVSGGTNITLYGSTLNIGHSVTIKIAGVPCKEIGLRQDAAWCVTDELSNGSSTETDTSSRVGPVELHIDDAVIEVENQIAAGLEFEHPLSKIFKYLPDPEIFSIAPEATTVSGIKNLTIKGKNLNSVENPRMLVNFASSVTGESLHVISEPCWFNDTSDGSTMICATPPLKNPAFHTPSERAPLVTHVAFLMDGVEKLRQLPKHDMELSRLLYYPDPEFHNLSENGEILQVPHDQPTLEIKGKFLNLALDESDVKVLFDNITVCPVESMTSEYISCSIPPLEEFEFTNTSKHSVSVSVGSLTVSVGVVEFTQDYESAINTILLHVFGWIAAICIIVIIYKCWCRRRRKKGPNFVVTFNANPHQNTCSSVTRQPSNSNDYQDLPSRRMRQNSAAAAAIPEEVCGGRSASIASVDEETIHLLESQNILVPRNYLTLGEVIGEGHFGCVYKGELVLPSKDNRLEVAVKTLHNSWSTIEQDSEAFLQEGLMMKDFHHHNVLTLIGVCFDADGSPMVIIPFMRHGDLLSYIRNENNNPTIKDLLMFGVQIAAGMKYLAEIKFVHRDLAARNCMLDDDETVKVADFGLSRDIYERDYYSSDNKKTKLPIKWMAPESIEKGTYTTKSDVWSYGVVLWELMTRGVAPYPGVDNWDILQYIKLGRRMPQPSYCPDLLYDIMLKCWAEDPKGRPTFAELEEQVKGVITKLQRKSRQRTVGLNVTYVNYPQTLAKEAAAEAT